MLVIGLNGPPRAGKDTAANIISRKLRGVRLFKFASPLKRSCHMSFGLMVPENMYEDVKDKPRDEFFGITPRQAYINHSEFYMKKLYGQQIFGKLMVRELDSFKGRAGPRIAVISDTGFKPEFDYVGHFYQSMLIQIHREGCDFLNDSRGYIEHENTFHIQNNGTIADLEYEVQKFARKFNLIP